MNAANQTDTAVVLPFLSSSPSERVECREFIAHQPLSDFLIIFFPTRTRILSLFRSSPQTSRHIEKSEDKCSCQWYRYRINFYFEDKSPAPATVLRYTHSMLARSLSLVGMQGNAVTLFFMDISLLAANTAP
jgi:hypothetical protein